VVASAVAQLVEVSLKSLTSNQQELTFCTGTGGGAGMYSKLGHGADQEINTSHNSWRKCR
jgi:hypothetical protein